MKKGLFFLIFQKVTALIITLFIVITATFFMMKIVPGDPFHDEKALPKEIHESLKKHYGLNEPLHTQYFKYLSAVVKWDLGPSFKYKGRTVNHIIKEGFPISLLLGLESIILAVTIGVLTGAVGALNHNHWLDKTTVLVTIFFLSIPNFAMATLLQYFIGIKLQYLPVARWGTFAHSILPAISLAALPTAFITKFMRKQMIDIMEQDYIKNAKAKGLSDKKIILHHVLRNALLPLVAYIGPLMANVLVGSFVIEKIFAIPGLGQWFVKSVMNRDYTVIMGLTVFYSLLLTGFVFLFDIFSLLIDPRIKHPFQSKSALA